MAQLIIGHTTESTVRVWVHGPGSKWCDVHLERESKAAGYPRRVPLAEERDFTGVVEFAELEARTIYIVCATFSRPAGTRVVGRFQTMPSPDENGFSFVLSSCNLSVVSINNMLSFALAAAGTAAVESSLDLRSERWNCLGLTFLPTLLRWPLRLAVWAVAGTIRLLTGLKQPGPPYIRSPFLKLNAVFDSSILTVVADRKKLPAVGDVLLSPTGQGVLACAPTEEPAEPGGASAATAPQRWLLVVTQATGTFRLADNEAASVRDEQLTKKASADADTEEHVGTLLGVSGCKPWYDRPAFFMHAGDQIYYDFPDERRRPEREQYRLAYVEAWFDDTHNGHLLAHWPHYMTLDDHEIADQFATDFNPPLKKEKGSDPSDSATAQTVIKPADPVAPAAEYRREALVAYDEYVQSRHPPRSAPSASLQPGAGVSTIDSSAWYEFTCGRARFFVLDTRSQRSNTAGHMIDPYQLDRLLDWMSRYRNDLKFIVTSVPFVAQFREPPEKAPDPTSTTRPGVEPNWYWRNQTSGSPDETRTSGPTDEIRNPANDKWSAKQFRGQRDRIIKHIADGRIEHVVFLAGDMHCCYHASMRIGVGSKYECITIHELAAGPVNQLQLATVDEFIPHYIGTAFGQRYEVVLDRFHGEINAVMHIKVSYDAKPPVKRSPDETVLPDLVPEIEWSVIRTLTDVGATAWVAPPPAVATSNDSPPTRLVAIKTKEDEPARWREPTMSGRIAFVRMRKPDELLPWDVQ